MQPAQYHPYAHMHAGHAHRHLQGMGIEAGVPAAANGTAADSGWVQFEFTGIKDRMGALERRSEALWHNKEGSEELRGLVDRLRADLDSIHSVVGDTQVRAAQRGRGQEGAGCCFSFATSCFRGVHTRPKYLRLSKPRKGAGAPLAHPRGTDHAPALPTTSRRTGLRAPCKRAGGEAGGGGGGGA